MIIAHIEGATRICGKAQGYLGLPLRDELINDTVNGESTLAMVTAWTPTPEELAALNAGASVHVRILGTTPPPMMVLAGPAPDQAQDHARSSAGSAHAKVADWLEDQARIATNSLHCGDNSSMIQQTHDWANKLEAAASHLRAVPQGAGK